MRSLARVACAARAARDWITFSALAVLLALSGCAESPSRPEPIPTSTLQGTVLDPDGVFAEGASVRIASEGAIGGSFWMWTATAGVEGRFSIAGVPAGSFLVDGFVAPEIGGRAVATVPGAAVDVHLSPPGYIRGIATRIGAGDQSGIVVSCDFPFALTTTDAAGRYLLWGPPGRWSVTAHSPGYTSTIVSVDVAAPGDTAKATDLRLQPDFNP
ncbi:MAG TPA: carboxypeptidase regulatory-like domain-containing protein [Candidatus Limnocylindria bacterium]|nr:carboxypeptidase regulatory-like domain-containing protein [Candidatus Limnocylindria bacterium]